MNFIWKSFFNIVKIETGTWWTLKLEKMVGRHFLFNRNLTSFNKVDDQNSYLNIIHEQERIIRELNTKIFDLEVNRLLTWFYNQDLQRQISVCWKKSTEIWLLTSQQWKEIEMNALNSFKPILWILYFTLPLKSVFIWNIEIIGLEKGRFLEGDTWEYSIFKRQSKIRTRHNQ